ncbi:MAG: TRAP transporter small permease [Eubacteriales bacterium]|nr:TRAP transporter small permease [Eubacteriales bacterium]MDD3844769.1 TRAP transporter small permease [Syntrophorhabdaceae bacterium]
MSLFERTKSVNRIIFLVAGWALMFMMLLTVTDVIMREFQLPVIGTYELVGLSAVVVIGFCIPYTTSLKSHISVDFFTTKLSGKTQKVFLLLTRILAMVIFFLIAYNLLLMANDLYKSGEVSLTIKMPFYPIAIGIGLCCFMQTFTLIVDFITVARKKS